MRSGWLCTALRLLSLECGDDCSSDVMVVSMVISDSSYGIGNMKNSIPT